MQPQHRIVLAFVIIILIVGGALWWIPFHDLSKGQLAIIGETNGGRSIYLLNPVFRSWHRLPTSNLNPYHIAWSPDGKKIAFTYSINNPNISLYDLPVTGIAIMNLENGQTQQLYRPPSNETLDAVTWSPDGQSLVFDVWENAALTAIRKLNIQTGNIQSTAFPKSLQPPYFGVDHLEAAQNNDYVIGGSGIYIAPSDLKDLRPLREPGYLGSFFLTPDEKEITIACSQSDFCSYSIDTGELTKTYPGALTDYGYLGGGNWSYDEKDVVYLLNGGGEEDPQYIMLADIEMKAKYVIYKQQMGFVVWQLAWCSAN
ncbi:MAG TPA: hypothetical protein VLX61_01065 [Anaerolineales bacterium]|nr:hypothetical protein [Anaerolineales bacterium]